MNFLNRVIKKIKKLTAEDSVNIITLFKSCDSTVRFESIGQMKALNTYQLVQTHHFNAISI
jgi:hypothetical protein